MPQHGPISYQTCGALNAAADNCVLLPTYYTGTDRSYLPQIGPGRALDPSRWFIVIPNMLGNGVSASPSNAANFIAASIDDNITAQHALLSSFGVRRVALIYGWSMGAMQAYAWAVTYPDMVAAMLAVCGSARCWPLNQVFIEGLRATMQAGKRAFGRAYAGWAYSAAFYRDELYKPMGFATLKSFLAFWEDDHDAWDKRDLLAMLDTWASATLGPAELGRITARTIIMPCNTDMYFTMDEAGIEAALIPGAELRPIISPYGHCAGAPGRFPAETAQIEQALHELLT